MQILRWRRPLPLLMIGAANVIAWAGPINWGLPWLPGIALLVALALAAGYVTEERLWFTVLVLMVPTFFIGNERHGRPLDWVLACFLRPWVTPLLIYYCVQTMGCLIPIYWLPVWTGQRMRRIRRGQ